MALAFGLGLLLDGGMAGTGFLVYAAAWPAGIAPAWILGLWLAFALTVVPLFGYLQARLWLAAALGGIGGPLAYLAAARGWEAVRFTAPAWHALLWLAIGWGIAVPLLCSLATYTVARDDKAIESARAMNLPVVLVVLWLLAAVMMAAGWRWQRRNANIGIVDVLWAMASALVRWGLPFAVMARSRRACCSPCAAGSGGRGWRGIFWLECAVSPRMAVTEICAPGGRAGRANYSSFFSFRRY